MRAILLLGFLVSTAADKNVFPEKFHLGVSTSAYQIEGGWNEDGKGESIWDVISHTGGLVRDNSTGDVACDSYHRLERDIALLKQLGVTTYRFSISWSRVLPTGSLSGASEAGLNYYDKLITALINAGIEPIVTLFHFDLPMRLQEQGGFMNRSVSIWFGDYANYIFSKFGDRVKLWNTINEPVVYCSREIFLLPLNVDREKAPYICSKNMLLAHATAYKIYRDKYKRMYKGKVTLANGYVWIQDTKSKNNGDRNLLLQYINGRFTHPILTKRGGWPPKLEEFMSKYSQKRGYNISLLEPFTMRDRTFIKGTSDYMAFNFYSTVQISKEKQVSDLKDESLVNKIIGLIGFKADIVQTGTPGLRRLISWLSKNYGKGMDVIITENGYISENRTLDDYDRINSINAHLKQVLLAIEDGAKVKGYNYWSLMDNFEWVDGYRIKFGLHDVDFDTLEVNERLSAKYYQCLTQNRTLSMCDGFLNN